MKSATRAVLFLCISLIPATPALAQCSLTKITEMPLIKLGEHYAVMVRINDEEHPMIVDTGAAVTEIGLNAAEDLELKQDSVQEGRVVGIGQTKTESYPNVIPSVLGFGSLVFVNRSTVAGKVDFGDKKPEKESIGLVGDDILSQFDVEFDFPAGKLTFYRASGCYDTFIPWTGGYSAIPFVHDNKKIVVDVILNGERNQAIIDTGNATSFVSRKLLARWRVPDSAYSKPIGKMGSPLNGGTYFDVQTFTFDTVTIGYDQFPAMKIAILDVDVPLAPINLGLDFCLQRKVWISYPNKWMFVSRAPTTLAYPVRAADPKNAQADAKTEAMKSARQ